MAKKQSKQPARLQEALVLHKSFGLHYLSPLVKVGCISDCNATLCTDRSEK